MSEWNDIGDPEIDQDSAVDEDLWTKVRDNLRYLFERAIRGGTHATGVRLAYARGTVALTGGNGTAVEYTGTITFSAATDGDPNFFTNPMVNITLLEATGGGLDAWGTTMVSTYLQAWDPASVDYKVKFNNGAPKNFEGTLIWEATGTATDGE